METRGERTYVWFGPDLVENQLIKDTDIDNKPITNTNKPPIIFLKDFYFNLSSSLPSLKFLLYDQVARVSEIKIYSASLLTSL